MGNKYSTKPIDRARDELFSQVVHCEVLEAQMSQRVEWLEDTMSYMAHQYPQLTDLQLAQLQAIGRRFIQPIIPHGSHANATNRSEWQTVQPA